jgi:hypothetical protein
MLKFLLVVLAATNLLNGCTSLVSYPVSNPEPFTDRGKIGSDATSRDEITSLFGQPDLKLSQDEIWIYGETRIFMERVPPPHAHEYFALLIRFDQDLANGYNIIKTAYPSQLCWPNDMCLEGHWVPIDEENGPKKLDRMFSAVTSRGSDDRSAKSFSPAKEECHIYVFRSFDFFQLPYPPSVTLGPFRDEPVPDNGYLFVKIKPGSHRLEAHDHHIDFHCDAGDLHFYTVSNRGFVSEPETKIEQVSEGFGREKVLDRRKLITW